MALDAAGKLNVEAARPEVFLVALGDAALNWAFHTARTLRSAGISAGYDLNGRSMKAQMREANRQNARYVVIVGDDELAAGAAQVKDMDQSSQRTVDFDQLAIQLKA